MKLKKFHKIDIGIGIGIILISLILIKTRFFFLIFGFGILCGLFPFVYYTMLETQIAAKKEEIFLEFARNLVESVKTGTPISKSIINMKNKPYGVLSEHIQKLANQIEMGIPLTYALQVFSNDINNRTVSRAITLIGQAEKAGGDIGEILESVTEAVSTSDKLKKERKSTISTLVVQGYIIFFIFIAIVLVMQFVILPMMGNIGTGKGGSTPIASIGLAGINISQGINQSEMANAFLYLLLVQGFFSGITIGKLSEGNAKAGIKHSFALVVSSFLISSIANVIWGA